MAIKGEWFHWRLVNLPSNPHNMTIKFFGSKWRREAVLRCSKPESGSVMELILQCNNWAAEFRARRARKDVVMRLKEDSRCS